LFLAELNELQLWATDIGNAYLEAYTTEKVYIIAGPEFGEREGHILIISKALYGLSSSGARWHDRFADYIRLLGFFLCGAEPDIWMKKNGNIYEYIAVYVDNLAIAMKNPKEFTDILDNKHKFKLKGTGPIMFHLGMDFTRDDDGTLCISPTKYIEKSLVKATKNLLE
jgi:Reverse transcriptase (RNA-dependent DNA polymerase)